MLHFHFILYCCDPLFWKETVLNCWFFSWILVTLMDGCPSSLYSCIKLVNVSSVKANPHRPNYLSAKVLSLQESDQILKPHQSPKSPKESQSQTVVSFLSVGFVYVEFVCCKVSYILCFDFMSILCGYLWLFYDAQTRKVWSLTFTLRDIS